VTTGTDVTEISAKVDKMALLFANLLVFGFLIKIWSRKPLYTYIREKIGTETLRQCRVFEKAVLRYEKLLLDLKFLLTCKKESLVPVFAKPKLSIEENPRLRKKIAQIIIKTEIKRKHGKKNEIKNEIERLSASLRGSLTWLLFHALRTKIRALIAVRRRKWKTTHERKLNALRTETSVASSTARVTSPSRGVVHNFSSYTLSDDEHRLLSFSLDHYIPGKDYGKRTQVEFERFYQEILDHTGHLEHLSERDKVQLKTRFMDTFTKFSRVKIPDEEKKVLEKLYKNPEIVILRQDKGRGVVILDKTVYISKGENFLNGPEFEKLDFDPTKAFQTQVQDTLRGMKKKFTKKVYRKLYPSSSRPGLYFGLAKVHKLKGSTDVNRLPMRPVISNIGTATYELSKYLAELLKPLTKSEYSIDSTKDFVDRIKQKRLPDDYELVSFDVVSLFTSVPLDYTIGLILDKIYKDKLIKTKLKKKEMRELLETCTKEMHFSFNGDIFRQIDGVAMGSPLGPVIANIFMVELEKSLVPQLDGMIGLWYRYVDDTFTFIRKDCVEEVLERLNGFHPNIKFTFEKEENGRISFLDVAVIKKPDGSFDTDVHRKATDTNVYVHWEAFAPKTWKTGTLKGLVRRAFTICSTEQFRNKEIDHLKKVFKERNGYPSRVIYECIEEVRRKIEQENDTTNENEEGSGSGGPAGATGETRVIEPVVCLPFKGKEGERILKQFRNALSKALPVDVKPRFAYKGRKIGSFFRVKDPVPEEHESNLVYAFRRDEETKYVGETKVRYGTRQHEHGHTDKKSAIYKFKQRKRLEISREDFEILEKGYQNTVKRKLAEALYIKELRPPLNEQVKSAKLCLFN
jgi:hypothetical protein